jgi:hypothetical protein
MRCDSFVNSNTNACLLWRESEASLASHRFVVRSQLHPVCVFRGIQEKAPVGLGITDFPKKSLHSANEETINEEIAPSNVVFPSSQCHPLDTDTY